MSYLHPANKNLNIHQGTKLNGFELLSGDEYNALGGKGRHNSNVGRITDAWASALSVGYFDACHLVHIPKSRPACYLDVNSLSFEQVYADAFRRISYLAKINTKHYNNSGKSFGCSRKQGV